MTAAWRPSAFPVQVPAWFRPIEAKRSSGAVCNNGPAGYSQRGVHQSGARPILYDAFNELRDGGTVPHHALDIMGSEGSYIVAAASGTVPETVMINGVRHPGAGMSPKGGNYAFIREPSGFTSYYAHMQSAPKVSPGSQVSAGQVIGYLGRTGNAAGGCPHLHFAVTDPSGNKINPLGYLQPLYDANGWKRSLPWGWLVGGGVALAVGYLLYRNRKHLASVRLSG